MSLSRLYNCWVVISNVPFFSFWVNSLHYMIFHKQILIVAVGYRISAQPLVFESVQRNCVKKKKKRFTSFIEILLVCSVHWAPLSFSLGGLYLGNT